ncbi:putative ABC transport system permease protein [Chitinophaga costaii]|uniref:Putative ABC transport system permease protein n=1 Tax=Chitinophaga costaii TaxID=1335309 RepID=A0A1C3YP28_9BACT|nr:ABC transporter permease [Chitinophaga costaii]PUZ30032.1 ABC transporter permease [Chitinophaga costaii]SCB71855.1 putative ABC transport system permease protein [Chitinophaga costaii]
MLLNYFKIAIAVLRRRKFFTFISLFGISFTLTIMLVLTAFITSLVGNKYPDKKRDRLLYIRNMELTGPQSMNSSNVSFYMLDHYVRSMATPVQIAIATPYKGTNTYLNNRKIEVNYKYTNADYWQVLDYDFLEGKPYTAQQVAAGERVTVISEYMKKAYFGNTPLVTGQYIEADNVKYRISGVVKSIPITNYLLYSDIYLPYTVSKTDYTGKGYLGNYTGILLANSKAAVPKIQQEYEAIIARLPLPSKEYDHLYSHALPYMQAYVATGDEKRSGMNRVLLAISIFTLLVMLLPTLNLVNINVTRILERSSEIGVRKAFGASSSTLVQQFIIENLLLTLLGGVIGVVLSAIILYSFNHAHLVANLHLVLNFTVLGIGLLICLVFGLLSGVYPAWRMSRMHVVTALKA